MEFRCLSRNRDLAETLASTGISLRRNGHERRTSSGFTSTRYYDKFGRINYRPRVPLKFRNIFRWRVAPLRRGSGTVYRKTGPNERDGGERTGRWLDLRIESRAGTHGGNKREQDERKREGTREKVNGEEESGEEKRNEKEREREKDIARSYERITARRRGVEHVYALVHQTPDSP